MFISCSSTAETLLDSCANKDEYTALQFLKVFADTNLDTIYKNGRASLIWTCRHGTTLVALEILKYPDKCGLDQISYDGDTAL
jgi:hypothetical protein